MLKLDYIICKSLPEQEEKYIHENIAGVNEKNVDLHQNGLKQDLIYYKNSDMSSKKADVENRTLEEREVPEDRETPEWFTALAEKYGITCQRLAQNGILISGDENSLRQAAELGMATICYLLHESEDGLEFAGSCEKTEKAEYMAAGLLETFGEKAESSFVPDIYVEGFEEVDIAFLRHVYERHHHIPWKILETERCVVKEFSMEYLDALFELYAGEGMTEYIEPLYPYEQEKEYQQAYIDNMYRFYGYGMWIVCDKVTGNLIGRAGVEHREELEGELELGYAIGTPYQRQGYATEVCKAILKYVKEELEVPSLCCLIEAGNEVSVHFARKLGFDFSEEMQLGEKKMRKYEYCF